VSSHANPPIATSPTDEGGRERLQETRRRWSKSLRQRSTCRPRSGRRKLTSIYESVVRPNGCSLSPTTSRGLLLSGDESPWSLADHPTGMNMDRPKLSEQARRTLEERLQALGDDRIPHLRREGCDLFERLLSLRNDVGLLSEECDVDGGRMTGNFPHAFSHVSLMIDTAYNLGREAGPAERRRRRAQLRSVGRSIAPADSGSSTS